MSNKINKILIIKCTMINFVLTLRKRIFLIIYDTENLGGQLYDFFILINILLGFIVFIIELLYFYHSKPGGILHYLEYWLTVIFAFDFFIRLIIIEKRLKYLTSPIGIIDFMAFAPTIFVLFLPQTRYLIFFKIIRIFRITRTLKIIRYYKKYVIESRKKL